MSTPIPAFVSMLKADPSVYQIRIDNGGNHGSLQVLSQAHYYYGVSGHSAATDGQSFLEALRVAFAASTADIAGVAANAWKIYLGSDYILRFDSGDAADDLTINLFDSAGANSTTFRTILGITSGGALTVPHGTIGTAQVLPRFWWSPEMPVCGTGPVFFDPTLSVGIPASATTAQQSADGSMAFTSNGFTTAAEYMFHGVSPYWRIRTQSGHVNADLETWWRNGPALGNRVLMWRNRDNAAIVNSSAPSKGSASPWNYIEYYPNEKLVAEFPAAQMTAYNLVFWNVAFGLNLTETGETPQ